MSLYAKPKMLVPAATSVQAALRARTPACMFDGSVRAHTGSFQSAPGDGCVVWLRCACCRCTAVSGCRPAARAQQPHNSYAYCGIRPCRLR